MPPYIVYMWSDPQMPHARMRTSTSSGPATGSGVSTMPVVPGPVTMTVFIDCSSSRRLWSGVSGTS